MIEKIYIYIKIVFHYIVILYKLYRLTIDVLIYEKIEIIITFYKQFINK